MKKIKGVDLMILIREHNQKNNVKNQFGDKNPLICYVVFKKENFKPEYHAIESRTYGFRSDNKFFVEGMGGNSIFATSIDKMDNIRLDYYLSQGKIEYCYIEEMGVL